MSASEPVARVLIDSALPQLDRLFDYEVPERLDAIAVPGVRVKVPLRSAGRIAEGYLVERAATSEAKGELARLEEVVSEARVLTPEVRTLTRRLADRAAGSANDLLRLAIPRRQVRVEKAWLANGPAEPIPLPAPVRAEGYADGLTDAAGRGARIALHAVPRLVQAGETWIGHWAATLAALAVTTLASGRSAILVVPDYRDQEQLEIALAALLPAGHVQRMDARQSNPDRYRAFLACLEGAPRIVIGNRSAVYAPVHELGLIALWDDGDPLHAEPLSPGVHARDAALVRQEQSGCALVIAGHTRSTEVQRLVELGWFEAHEPERHAAPRVIPTAEQDNGGERMAAVARIPSSAWRIARDALEHGPVLVQVARPGNSAAAARLGEPVVVTVDAGRTAEDLGRAFPGTRVVVADGERPVQRVDARPALIIATRGAEPIADGGYRAVLLLDGPRMLSRESLRVAEDCLRWWSNAVALAAVGATTVLVGVGGAPARALVTWRQELLAAAELEDRRRLRFPPAVRTAVVTSDLPTVREALQGIDELEHVDALDPEPVEEGRFRAIVRFDYGVGGTVAEHLRAAVIRNATGRRSVARVGGSRPRARLQVRLDGPEAFG